MHYLDNSATTPVLPESAAVAAEWMVKNFGNPSSLHQIGFIANQGMESARKTVADSIGASSKEVVFTSGGTESNNLAIFGAVNSLKKRGNRVITSLSEHASISSSMKELEAMGFEVIYLRPRIDGSLSLNELEEAINEDTILISLATVNNETGVILPIEEVSTILKKKQVNALLHTDAVQAYCKLDLRGICSKVDLMTMSGHKIHAPKGVGALYVSQNAHIKPHTFGGGQESGLRSGTESMPLIMAFAKAVQSTGNLSENYIKVQKLNQRFREGLENITGIHIHSPIEASPYILAFCAGRVKSQTMQNALSNKEIYLSAGSTCGKGKPSRILKAMGVSKEEIDASLRVSFSRFNCEEDVDAILKELDGNLKSLAHF